MQSKKIGIFTKGNKNPLHPRIELEITLLEQEGHRVQLFCPSDKKPSFKAAIKRILSLSLFEFGIIEEFKDEIKNQDINIIYDTQLLPLSQYKKQNKRIIFETLDDNVELIVYHVFKKIKLLSFLRSITRYYLKKLEQHYLTKYVDQTIVNSKRLTEVFSNQKAVLNFYASPFENTLPLADESVTNSALLYLGKISLDKGLKTMLKLAKEHDTKLYLFGNLESTEENELQKLIANSKEAVYHPKLDIKTLTSELKQLITDTRLIGLSLIESVHISYLHQDANKDIDYLALGIPFIGNERPTTKKIIDAGCGVLLKNEEGIKTLLTNKNFYNECANKCLSHYQINFSKAVFSSVFLRQINASYEQK